MSSRPCPSAPIAGTRLGLSSHTCARHRLAGRRPPAALRRHVLAHAQRRRLFGVSVPVFECLAQPPAVQLHRVWCCWCTQEGGSTLDGSASGSSSSDEDAPPSTAQPPQQQQPGAAAAAAEAERQRKRQDALRRIEASTAKLRKRSTGSAMVDAALQQMYARVSLNVCRK